MSEDSMQRALPSRVAGLLLLVATTGCQIILGITIEDDDPPQVVLAGQDSGTLEPDSSKNEQVNNGGRQSSDDRPQTPAAGAHGGLADAGDVCATGTCCIAGRQHFPRAPNPNNACELCEPSVDTSQFSAIADGTACGTGCNCRTGKPSETRCGDFDDNDNDNQLDCADPDCTGQSCFRSGTTGRTLSVTRDIARSSFGSEQDGQTTIPLSAFPGHTEKTSAVLEFANVPAHPSITVLEAELTVSIERGGAGIRVLDPAGNQLAYAADVPAGIVTFDVTRLVKAWLSAKELNHELSLELANPSAAQVLLRSSEHQHGPRLVIFYESACTATGECPKIAQ